MVGAVILSAPSPYVNIDGDYCLQIAWNPGRS